MHHRAKLRQNRLNRCRDMAIFQFFKMAAAAILDFWNVKFLTVGLPRGLNCTIVPNFVKIAQTAADIWLFFDFQDGCRRHVGFAKFQIFDDRDGQEVRNASSCQIASKSIEPLPRYGDFSIFQDGGRRHLGFLKCEIFNGRTPKRVELHHRTKFRRNRTYRGWDMAIFPFSRWLPPPFWICKILNFWRLGRSRGSNYIRLPNFVKIAQTAAEI